MLRRKGRCRRKNDLIFFRRLRAAELCEAFSTRKTGTRPVRAPVFHRHAAAALGRFEAGLYHKKVFTKKSSRDILHI